MPLSKNQIRKVFEDIATNHWMIHSFSYGNEWEITETPKGEVRVNYPILFVEPLGNSYPMGKINHNYNIYILDITKKGESRATLESEMEVESDTFKICSDIVSLLNAQAIYSGFTLDRNLTRTDAIVYSEKDQDELTGHRLSITLSENFDANYCAVPGTGFGEDVPPSNCPAATLNVNGVLFTVISSGDTYSLVVKDTDGAVVGEKIGSEYIVPAAGGSGFSLNEYLNLQNVYG